MLKNRKLLSPLSILMIIIIIGAGITWLIPAGRFDTLKFSNGQFEFTTDQGTQTLDASQAVLDSLHVSIPLASFQKRKHKESNCSPWHFSQN